MKRRKLKQMGVGYLDKDTKLMCERVIKNLAEYSVFVVPVGKLESWLTRLQIAARKSGFVKEYFEKSDTINPGSDDVWLLMDKITEWVDDKDRRGM